jgi:glycosyltransferase involved in cell wall biosynthesis
LVLAEPEFADGVIIKKGVLLIKFTATFGILYASVDRNELSRLFHIVLEPSWSGYADPSILCWLNWPEKVLVQSPERADREFLLNINSNLVPVPYGSGDWIDPEQFAPLSTRGPRGLDVISVANYGWWKRNHAFIRAVARAVRERPGFHAALVLASFGKSPERVRELRALIRHYRVEDKLAVLESLSQAQLRDLYGRTKALFFATLKEGSSRVIYESMSMGCPVVVLRNNVGVNKDYINPNTGWLLSEDEVVPLLTRLDDAREARRPRDWFVSNLGPVRTTAKLADDLKRLFPGEHWHADDLAVKKNAPEARYLEAHVNIRPLEWWMQTSRC